MTVIQVSTTIDAPIETVFALFSDLEHAPERIKAIKKLELLTPGPVGVGTRFRETRVLFGKEATEEMYFTVFEPSRRYEVRADSCGAAYRSVYEFRPQGSGTVVDVTFEARPVTLFAKLMAPVAFLMKGMLKKCLTADVEDLKRFAEAKAVPAAV
jgi:carbon monoxide dehydrogenase subunit G